MMPEKGYDEFNEVAEDAARYQREAERLRSLLQMPLTSAELKLVDKHCDWVAFKHAWNAVVKHRLEAVNGQSQEEIK